MVNVLGVSEDLTKVSNRVSVTYYICEVNECPDILGLNKGDIIGCFFMDGEKYFSKYRGPLLWPEEKTKFMFGSLGKAQVGSGGDIRLTKGDALKRMKDIVFKI